MILGILSDTHEDKMGALPHIIKKFLERKVDIIIHAGDIEEKHIDMAKFGNLPVYCALTDEQNRICEAEKFRKGGIAFCSPPAQWIFTTPGQRIVDLSIDGEKERIYVGHKRSFEFVTGAESELLKTLFAIRKDNDGVRYLFSGHTHHQILTESRLITFVNPGAVTDSMGIAGGYEYALVDTSSDRIIFSRIPASVSTAPYLKLGVISDSLTISQKDVKFWEKLAVEFVKEKVTHIIHCGNLNLDDVGRPELQRFKIYYSLRDDQIAKDCGNWHSIDKKKRVVDISGYQFYVQWNLSAELLHKSERDMHYLALEIQKQNSEVNLVLCGFTHSAFYEEGETLIILNPGDVIQSRDYAIIELPLYEITFGRIPYDPLPSL